MSGTLLPHLIDLPRLTALGRQLRAEADQLHAARARLRTAAGRLNWESPAAGVFEVTLTGLLARLGRLGSALEELADLLRGHANRAAHRRTELLRSAESARRLAGLR